MDKCIEETVCEEKEESPKSQTTLNQLRNFSKYLVEALASLPNPREVIMAKYTGPKGERSTLTFKLPCYRQKEGCYTTNKFILNNENIKIDKITRFDENEFSAPMYEDIQIKREKWVPLLVRAWIFLHYKNKTFAAYSDWTGLDAYIQFNFNKKYNVLAKELVDGLRNHLKDKSFLKGERIKLVKGYYFDFLDYPKLDWDDIILSKEVKDEIFLNIVFPLSNEELCKKHSLQWRRGVLLGGEPGTGKTKLAKVLCNKLDGCTVIWVTAESISESNHIKTLFTAARYFAPVLIVIEDIDFLGKDREIQHSPVVGELLTQLDGSAPNDGIFVLASSNRPGLLDKALANRPGRFDVKLEVKLPSKKARLKMIELFSKGKQFESNIDFNDLAVRTEGLTGAHIQESLVYAMLDSLHKGNSKIKLSSIDKAIKRMKDAPRLEMIS